MANTCCDGTPAPASTANSKDSIQIRKAVKELYGAAAREAGSDQKSSCCGSKANTLNAKVKDAITGKLYSDDELTGLPVAAQLASLGCGNPTALADLAPGETVLDLGSGGGIDVLLSARRVGPSGFAYGLDMTDEMLELAERNRQEAGVENVKFLRGHIEEIPLPAATVDVIISNCVINLSADKDAVLAEAFRVLKTGGRFAVSDILFDGNLNLPPEAQNDLLAWSGCIAGALTVDQYKTKLATAGFTNISIEPTRRYTLDDIRQAGFDSLLNALTPDQQANLHGRIISAFIRATKPES
jgi:arsenite methyltransferase